MVSSAAELSGNILSRYIHQLIMLRSSDLSNLYNWSTPISASGHNPGSCTISHGIFDIYCWVRRRGPGVVADIGREELNHDIVSNSSTDVQYKKDMERLTGSNKHRYVSFRISKGRARIRQDGTLVFESVILGHVYSILSLSATLIGIDAPSLQEGIGDVSFSQQTDSPFSRLTRNHPAPTR